MPIEFSSFNWVKLLLDSKELSANATYMGLYLATYMNSHQEMAWPSHARIQAQTKLSKSTVIKYLKELEEAGWLITKRKAVSVQTTGGVQACNRYYINIPEKVVREATLLDKGGIADDQRGYISEPKGVREIDTNNNIITNNNNRQFKNKFAKNQNHNQSQKPEFPPDFDPSKDCRQGEQLDACKIRAWRQHKRP